MPIVCLSLFPFTFHSLPHFLCCSHSVLIVLEHSSHTFTSGLSGDRESNNLYSSTWTWLETNIQPHIPEFFSQMPSSLWGPLRPPYLRLQASPRQTSPTFFPASLFLTLTNLSHTIYVIYFLFIPRLYGTEGKLFCLFLFFHCLMPHIKHAKEYLTYINQKYVNWIHKRLY